MKIDNNESNNILDTNITGGKSFTIKNSPKAFAILSSGLYKDKIRAIVRELGANAKDSHIAAGCPDKPFEIHTPTHLEPWFSVKDFGIGLDHDGITNVYTTYFESTKTQSNDYIGCLGLGSKSPFSYTDNFVVTAVKDKVKRVYTAFISEVGIPDIVLISEEPTDEHNGVEVKISVKDYHDCRQFVKACSSVYMWFDVRPIDVAEQVEYASLPLSLQVSPKIWVYDYKESYSSSCYLAKQGGVVYPISISSIASKYLTDDIRHKLEYGSFRYKSVLIDFNIGELDVAASREELSYIPSTQENIANKLIDLCDKIKDSIVIDLDKEQDPVKKTILFNRHNSSELRTFCPKANEVSGLIVSEYTCGKQDIGAMHIDISAMNFAKKLSVYHYTRKIFRTKHSARSNLEYNNGKYTLEYRSTNKAALKEYLTVNVLSSHPTRVIVARDRKDHVTALKDHIYRTFADSYVVIVTIDETKHSIQQVRDFFKNYYVEVDTFESLSVKNKERNKDQKEEDDIVLLEHGSNGWYERKFKESEIPDCYYVTFSGWSMDDTISAGTVNAFKHYCMVDPSYHKPVYGVRKLHKKLVEGNPKFLKLSENLPDVEAKVVEEMSKLISPNAATYEGSLARYFAKSEFLSEVKDERFSKFFNFVKDKKYYDEYSSVGVLMKMLPSEKQHELLSKMSAELTEYLFDARSDYPLLYRFGYESAAPKDIVEYINAIYATKNKGDNNV